jgi:hypothetical protein
MGSKNSAIEWDANTPHTKKFVFDGNFVCKVYGDAYHQLIAPLKGSATMKLTIKKYGSQYDAIAFGLLTENRRNA